MGWCRDYNHFNANINENNEIQQIDTNWSDRWRMPIALSWGAHWEIIAPEVNPEQQFRSHQFCRTITNILFYGAIWESIDITGKNELEK